VVRQLREGHCRRVEPGAVVLSRLNQSNASRASSSLGRETGLARCGGCTNRMWPRAT
jgi:hypothetical protein